MVPSASERLTGTAHVRELREILVPRKVTPPASLSLSIIFIFSSLSILFLAIFEFYQPKPPHHFHIYDLTPLFAYASCSSFYYCLNLCTVGEITRTVCCCMVVQHHHRAEYASFCTHLSRSLCLCYVPDGVECESFPGPIIAFMLFSFAAGEQSLYSKSVNTRQH